MVNLVLQRAGEHTFGVYRHLFAVKIGRLDAHALVALDFATKANNREARLNLRLTAAAGHHPGIDQSHQTIADVEHDDPS